MQGEKDLLRKNQYLESMLYDAMIEIGQLKEMLKATAPAYKWIFHKMAQEQCQTQDGR